MPFGGKDTSRRSTRDDFLSRLTEEAIRRQQAAELALQAEEERYQAAQQAMAARQQELMAGPKGWKEMTGRERFAHIAGTVLPQALLTFASDNPSAAAAQFLGQAEDTKRRIRERRESATLAAMEAEQAAVAKRYESAFKEAVDSRNDALAVQKEAGLTEYREGRADARAQASNQTRVDVANAANATRVAVAERAVGAANARQARALAAADDRAATDRAHRLALDFAKIAQQADPATANLAYALTLKQAGGAELTEEEDIALAGITAKVQEFQTTQRAMELAGLVARMPAGLDFGGRVVPGESVKVIGAKQDALNALLPQPSAPEAAPAAAPEAGAAESEAEAVALVTREALTDPKESVDKVLARLEAAGVDLRRPEDREEVRRLVESVRAQRGGW